MKTEPLIRAAKRVRAKSSVGQLEKLMAEQTRWKRKRTIAETKLATVRVRIENVAMDLAKLEFIVSKTMEDQS